MQVRRGRGEGIQNRRVMRAGGPKAGLAAACLLLAWLAWAGPAAAVNLPRVQDAGLNTWISPPTSGVPVKMTDFPKGSTLEKLTDWFAHKKPCQITAIYRLPAKPGLYTATIKAPPRDMYQVNGLWVFGNPLAGKDKGKDRTSWVQTHSAYSPHNRKCQMDGARANFRIASESKGRYLYLVAFTSKPGTPFSLMLQYPGVPDSVVGGSGTTPPWCPEAKGFNWGNVFTRYPHTVKEDSGADADASRQAAKDKNCPNGCAARVIAGTPQNGVPQTGTVVNGKCPRGYETLPAGQGVSCIRCPQGYKLAKPATLGGQVRVACLKCPPGQEFSEVRREEGTNPSGLKWSQSNYACLGCPPGYDLTWPMLRMGQRPDGAKWGFREAACWRCPPGTVRKETKKMVTLPDGSVQEQKTFHCAK